MFGGYGCVFVIALLLRHAALSAGRELSLTVETTNGAETRNHPVDRETLGLCDCRPAAGEPEGLSCEGEGYVIAGFERHGKWVVGGDQVPLSRAICCRPCRNDGQGQDDGDVVVSLGCHASSDPVSSFRCERREDEAQGGVVRGDTDPTSFVVGFTSASRVFAPGEAAYYPSDAAECCSPSLLLSNGEVTGLEPCDCIEEAAVSCGGDVDGRALVGFDDERVAPNGHFVPVGAAKCCRLCVGTKASMDCAALDHCNGKGACILGSCACVAGWSGASCAVREAGEGDVPAWAIAVIVVGSCLLGVLAIGSLAYICELVIEAREARQREAEEDEDENAPTRPLLIQLDRDDDGSVGSQDTTDDEEGDEGDSEVAGRIAAAERELNAETDAVDDTGEDAGDDALDDGDAGGGIIEEDGTEEDIETIKARLKRGHGPLAGVLCGVCLDRPVQICVIPCGHVCMCRRCSRRVQRCPVCRSIIARRQKLYV